MFNNVLYPKASEPVIKECFELVKENLKQMYEETIGWNDDSKLKEMQNPNMHFFVVNDEKSNLLAFCSFTEEYGTEVENQWIIYCYEIQVRSQYQKLKIGTLLMNWLEQRAKDLGAFGIMLTCFCKNEIAMRFYQKRGYKIDQSSPTSPNVPYRILSLKIN